MIPYSQEANFAIKLLQERFRKQVKQMIIVPIIVSIAFGLIIILTTGSIMLVVFVAGIIFFGAGFIVLLLFCITFLERRILETIRKTILLMTDNQDIEIETIMQNIETINFGVKKIMGSLDLYKDLREVEYYNIILKFLYSALMKLRADLNNSIIEKQAILRGAQREIQKNIEGTNELNKIAELQSARLDRQIDQFKELQRMLTRIT